MLICYNCGEIFDEWDIKYEKEPHGEIRGHCPNCLDDQFGEPEECARCGKYYPPTRMAGAYCEDCRDDLLERAREAIADVLDEEEIGYLEHEIYVAGRILNGKV